MEAETTQEEAVNIIQEKDEGDLNCRSDRRDGKKWMGWRNMRGENPQVSVIISISIKQDWPRWLAGAILIHWEEGRRTSLGRKVSSGLLLWRMTC